MQAQAGVEHRQVATERGRIAYVETGEGEAALFVHGVFMNSHLWRGVVAELGGERRCIAIDLPAHGGTRADDDDDLSLTGMATLLASFCDALGLDQVDLVANDTGGAIAQLFAVLHPERLRSLTLTNCDTHDNLPPAAFKGVADLAGAGKLGPVVARLLASPDLARSAVGLGSGYEHPEETIQTYLGPFAEPDRIRQLERFITSVSAAELVAAEPRLRELTVPTLVVWGTGDTFFDVSWAHWLQATVPGVTEVVELEGAKLFFPDERASELVPHLRRHWSALLPGAGRL